MMLRRSLPALALVLLAAQFNTLDAYARQPGRGSHPTQGLIKVAERAVSMREAINRVRQQTGGRVLDAQDRGDHYRVKVLTPEGEVRVFRVDARTGAIR